MKWLIYVLLAALVGGGWMLYSNSGRELAEIEAKIEVLENSEDGEGEEELPKLESEKQSIEGQKTFNGILLAFLSAGLLGILFVFQVLPAIAHRFTHAVYDSAEMVEKDPMHDARSLVAQGDYEGAITAFRAAAAADPMNRLPWVEIAKIQKDNLEQPLAAITTIRYALETQEWQVNDAAYFLFRLAELYDEHMSDRASAAAILQQVIDQFPETRHSANARHKLHDWGLA
jgi:tetratricopeptide (TPR) repeat protein